MSVPASAYEEWLTVKEASAYCGVSRQFLEANRYNEKAPPAHRRGRKFIYCQRELDEWKKQQRTR